MVVCNIKKLKSLNVTIQELTIQIHSKFVYIVQLSGGFARVSLFAVLKAVWTRAL